MSRFRSTRIALLLFLLAAALAAQQPPGATTSSRPSGSEEERKGSIAGTIVSAKTGEILKGVDVNVRRVGPEGLNTSPPVMDDMLAGADGRFEFKQLPAGTYQLNANKTGYGGQFAFRPQALIVLAAGESRGDVVMRMQSSAVVTGHVFDAYGDPLPKAKVYAIGRRVLPGRPSSWVSMKDTETDDLGEYRLHDLAAGKYVLAAQAAEERIPLGSAYIEFASSYYPGASSREQATPIKLAYGAELTGVDFRLEHSAKTTVRGGIVDESGGKACSDCGLRIAEGDTAGFEISAYPTEEGIFVIHGLRPGVHPVTIWTGGDVPRRFRDEIQVPESGETEVVLSVGNSQVVSGELLFEKPPEHNDSGAQTQERAAQEQKTENQRPIMVVLEPVKSTMYFGGRGVVPPEGGAFEIPNVAPDEYTVRVQGTQGYLRSVTLNGRDVGAPQITVSRNGPLVGLALRVAFDGPTLSGTVKAANEGTPMIEQFVIAVPGEDSDSYAYQGRARIEPGGTFTISNLVPGSYTLFVTPSMVDVEDPELRRLLEPYSKHVTLRKNETENVELELVPGSVELW